MEMWNSKRGDSSVIGFLVDGSCCRVLARHGRQSMEIEGDRESVVETP